MDMFVLSPERHFDLEEGYDEDKLQGDNPFL